MKYKTKANRRKPRNNLTHKKFIKKLLDLYPKCKHDDCRDYSKYDGHKVTYGEMEYDGIQKLYSAITKKYNPKIDSFMDIGSGRGKLCMYMAAQPKIKRVLGVELVEQRHKDASILKDELKSEFANKVELLNKDIFDVNLITYAGDHVFLWFSNLCFDQTTTNLIFEKIQKELPVGTFICCSKKPENEIVMTYLESMQIPMSWSTDGHVYIYKT